MALRSGRNSIRFASLLGVLSALASPPATAATSHSGGGHAGGGHGGGHHGGGHGGAHTTYTFTTVYLPGSPPEHGYSDEMLSIEQMRDLTRKPLISDGTPMAVNVGTLTAGEAFFHVGVKHGVTGILKNDVTSSKGLFHQTLPAGQALYGIPMAGTDDAGIVWCAPRVQAGKDVVKHWTTICLPLGDSGYVWIETHPAMMTVKLNWLEENGGMATAPEVDRRAVDLPDMTLSYVFSGWTREGWLTVDVELDWGEGPQVLRTISLPPDPNGDVIVKAMGGRLVVHALPGDNAKAASDATVAIQAAPIPGAPIDY